VRQNFATVILLVRHGQTTSNVENLFVGRGDPMLTELGQRQARSLSPFLTNVREVWCSPLTRALDTAGLCLPGMIPTVKESFIEQDFGDLEGTPVSNVSREEWDRFLSDSSVGLGGGESIDDVDARVYRELNGQLADPASLLHSPDEHLLVVSHVSPIKSAMTWALGVSGTVAWRTRLDNCSITAITSRRGQPSLVHFNLVPHENFSLAR